MSLPVPKLPDATLPVIRNLPSIPQLGCAGGGGGGTYIGEQFGNLPDLDAVLHIKARVKQLQEMIATMIEGYVPAVPRQIVWAQRVITYTNYITELIATLNAAINAVTSELTAAINFANAKIGEVNQAKADILGIPASARTAAQRLMLNRYTEYAGELNAQVSRLQDSIACISG